MPTYEQWERYGPEGPPESYGWPDPVEAAQSLVHDARPGSQDKKKQVRAIIRNGLPLQRGRSKGSGLEQTETEFRLYKQGYTPKETFLALGIPWTEQEGRKLTARLRSIKRRLPAEDRQAAISAHWEGARSRKPARPPRT